jgi:toxin CcdB
MTSARGDHRQFDVRSVRDGRNVDLVVILQANALAQTATVVVAPLIPAGAVPELSRATPLVEIDGAGYLVAVHLAMTIHRRSLGNPVASLADRELELKAAIDTVFFGI